MHHNSNRATATALSTMLLALLLASSFTSTPTVHGQSATVKPRDYPIFCDSTGNLAFTFNTSGATWKGVAIELPKEFMGLADGNASKVSATSITYDPRFIQVYDEELYYPYDRDYYWIQICAPSIDYPTWPGISGTTVTVTISDITAPSIAGDYPVNLYYTFTNFPCTYRLPTDFSDGNRGNPLNSVTVRVQMREEASTISGTVSGIDDSDLTPLNAGYVIATIADGPLKGKVVAKTTIDSDSGAYTLTGLYGATEVYGGSYMLTAWGKVAASELVTIKAYTPTDLPSPVTLGLHDTLTDVNIAVNRGGEISGSVRLRLHDGTPVTPNTAFSGAFTLPGAELPVRLELVDSAGRVVYDTTVNVPATSTHASYSLKEIKEPYEYAGIPAGTYKLKAYAFGFVQTTPVSVLVTAPGKVTTDVSLVKGGGISGTIYYHSPQGTIYALTEDTTILVEAVDSAGALKGAWIGTALAGQDHTNFLIQGAGELIQPTAPSGHTTVQLKTYAGRGVKDGGLADGGYTLKASVGGFIQPTPHPTATISLASEGAVTINLKKGGTIIGTIYATNPTTAPENWQRATSPTWDFSTDTATRIHAYIYTAADELMGYETAYQNSATQTAAFTFSGRLRSTAYLQCGYRQTALADGTYKVKLYGWGYWQPTPYPTTIIYQGGNGVLMCHLRRGSSVNGTITFPSAITGLLKIEAVAPTGETQGAAFYSITTPATELAYTIYGKYKHGLERDGGIVDGGYTIKLTLKGFAHPPLVFTIAGGSSATINFDAHRLGKITGSTKGTVTYQPTPAPLSWVKITLSSPPVAYTTYSADGSYSIPVPGGTYTMTFSAFGYKPQTTRVTIRSGAIVSVSADLVESFEPIPEFPLGAVFTLAASLALAFYLLRWIRKPITPRNESWRLQKHRRIALKKV